MKRAYPRDRLTEAEASKARTMVEKFGAQKAANKLGLADVSTLYKAIARLEVHRLTAFMVRSRLTDRTI